MERVVVQVPVRHRHPEHRAEHDLGLADRVRRTTLLLQRRDVVACYRPVGLGQPAAAEERDHVQPQRVRVGVLGVSLDLVVPEKRGRVPPDRPRRAGGRIQPAGRATSDLGGVPLCLVGDRERLLLRAEGASRPVAAVRGLVDAAVADPLLALPAFRICRGQAPNLGRNLGRKRGLHLLPEPAQLSSEIPF